MPKKPRFKGGRCRPEDILMQIAVFLRAVKSERRLRTVNRAIDFARRRLYREAIGIAAEHGWDQLGAFVLASARLHPGRGENSYEGLIAQYTAQWEDLPGWFQDFLDACVGHCTTSSRALTST